MVKVVRSYPAPESLKRESRKVSGSYKCQDVIEQLINDFHGKCYICETKNLTDIQVEHLLPHKGGLYPERKFEWENLFLSCPHCNTVKNQRKYDDGILDCCKVDPEEYLSFELNENDVEVVCYDSENVLAKRTAMLVEEVFETKNTGNLTYQSECRLKRLQNEMGVFYKKLLEYRSHPENRLTGRTLLGMLDRASEFAGFKRSYVRKHQNEYPQLYRYILSEET